MHKLPVFKTIKNSLNFIIKNYKLSISFILAFTLVQYSQYLTSFINPKHAFIFGVAFLFYYAFINPLFSIKESESPTIFVKRYAFSGLIYAGVVLMFFVLYDIYEAMLFYYMFLGASLYVAFFFLIRTLFKKKTLFSKKIFAASIKKMAAIMLIIFAGFMMMYFVYEFLIFILQYAAIPAFIQDNIITHDTFVRYARYTGTTAIYAIIFSVFISSCFAWVGVIDEGENSVSHAIFKLGKNFYRLALIIISIYVITVGTAYLLRIIPWEINIPQKVINAFMILFAFVTYLKAYKFIYKQKK